MKPEEVYAGNREVDEWWSTQPYKVRYAVRDLVEASVERQEHLDWDKGYQEQHPEEASDERR